jgi:hypothetical protein
MGGSPTCTHPKFILSRILTHPKIGQGLSQFNRLMNGLK